MSRSFFSFLILGIAAFAAGRVQARDLSWSDCVQLAAQNNSDLQIALDNLKSSEELQVVSSSHFYPQLSGVLGASESNNTNSNSLSNSFLSGDSSRTYSAQINLAQNLFAGFLDVSKRKQAEANTEALRAGLMVARAKLSADLKQAFQILKSSQELLLLSQDILKRRENNLRLVELRYDSGRENKGSVLLSQAYEQQSKYDVLQAENQIQTAQAQLAYVLGLKDKDLHLIDSIPHQPPPKSAPDFDRLVEHLPELAALRAQELSARWETEIGRSAFYPNLDLNGSVGKVDTTFFPSGGDRWNIGLTLSVPLFNGGRDWGTVRSAAAKQMAALQALRGGELQFTANLQKAFHAFSESVEKLQVDSHFLQAQATRAEIARSKYNNGLMSFEEWDLVENDLILRQRNLLSSQRDRVLSEAAWEQTQGIGVLP